MRNKRQKQPRDFFTVEDLIGPVETVQHNPVEDVVDPTKPSPVRSDRVTDWTTAPEVRRLHCVSYNRCLAVTAKNGWDGFSCNKCSVFEAQDHTHERADLDGIGDLLLAVPLSVLMARTSIFAEQEENVHEEEEHFDDSDDAKFCPVCGGQGHNSRSHAPKDRVPKCSLCGAVGHTWRDHYGESR